MDIPSVIANKNVDYKIVKQTNVTVIINTVISVLVTNMYFLKIIFIFYNLFFLIETFRNGYW